jgi:hypothetical protein
MPTASLVYRLLSIALLLLIFLLPAGRAGHADEGRIDFRLLYQAARIANQAYDVRSEILGDYPNADKAWVSTPGNAEVQYVYLYSKQRNAQVIAVRGTDNDVNWELDKDTRGVMDQRTGILMHSGFRTAAEAIYRDVRPRLRKDTKIYLTGHSLGGAVAAILGIYLMNEQFDIAGIYTFGQPKFTDAAGARTYQRLPLLRVVYQNDVVATFPNETAGKQQRYAHIGPVVNLLQGPYYLYLDREQALRFSQDSLRRHFTRISVPDHKMKWYLQGLKDKLDKAVRIDPRDREKHIVRHKAGTGVETAPARKQFNFNRQ